ncbi:hypothetical protein GCM10023215_65330 [Pseudonocardia yuanmonensis]|uniref:Uncharacterized protein n=1 Tax=Pseudonocardia yuanmonensis TaxID=1095914 RepID=A0ABP8XTQ3_9PSEU
MSSETDQPRQRTVAELLAENGAAAASGRRRRRREADDGEPVGAPPAAEGPGTPGRHGGTQAWRPQPTPEAPAEPWRNAGAEQPTASWERGPGPRLEREADEEPGDERGAGAPSSAALGFGPPAPGRAAGPNGFGRGDAGRNGFGPPGAGQNGFRQSGPAQNAPAPSGPALNAPAQNGPAQNPPGPNGPGQNGFGLTDANRNGFGSDDAGRNGFGPNGAGRNGFRQSGPGQNGLNHDGPAPFGRPTAQPGRPEAPARGADAWGGGAAGTVGLPQEAPRPGAPWSPGGQAPGRPGEPGTEQLGRVRAPQDDPMTAPFGSVYAGGPPTRFGAPPTREDEDDAGPPTQFGAPPLDDDEDDAGPPTQLGGPPLHDEDDDLDDRYDGEYGDDDGYGDDTYRAPAGLGRRAPERAEEEPEEDEGTAQGWAVVIGQWIAGALVGAAVWVGFRYLWFNLPVVALAAAVIITVGLVLGVRALLRNDDLRTTAFAVGVGLLLTVSPAILVLLER